MIHKHREWLKGTIRMATRQRHMTVVTGTRAEFGLLASVMHAIAAHPRLRLSTVVTGLHLVSHTWRDVAAAGFRIDARVTMQKKSQQGRNADVQALARGIAGLGEAFDQLNPDVVIVLGDRIEALAAATAASVGGMRVAHIHGGDRAEGVADEAMRHAISKLAHIHFPATAKSRQRLIRMGEDPAFIFNVGSPAMDMLNNVKPAPATEAYDLIIVQHPIGSSDQQEQRWMQATLRAARRYRSLILKPNHDTGAAGILCALEKAEADQQKQGNMTFIDHLPREKFVAQLAACRAIVGNSSAGLIEAAALKVPCVNIGPRQAGREKPANVIDCDYGTANVQHAIEKALTMDRKRIGHPYGKGDAGQRIAVTLAQLKPEEPTLRKHNQY